MLRRLFRSVFPSKRKGKHPLSENRSPQPEIHAGEILDLMIDQEGSRGINVGTYKGMKIHVPNADLGQVVKVKITKVHGSKANAIIVGEKKKGKLF
ncbi:hypothetical protein J4460_04145 [Candidatus Woesearchaeota archaeon]|nr:hypothetical protein [Candidatus Woesearchaeota archaeon]HIH38101.1 hypothetical protein [Candidatus Woesearchaeota archaeon]HIH48835.1 hypothetical protein [Candidatus Woesearchaeota archaeon]HIJ03166.1 hypothetical protein [Candidatus Woesearchaeota archaeon]